MTEAAADVAAGEAGRLAEDPGDRPADGWIVLRPARPGPAEIAVRCDADVIEVCVGPFGSLHEILVDRDGGWREELRACVVAVLSGRYVEEVRAEGRQRRLTMTFGNDAEPIVVVHHGGRSYGPPRLRRFPPYAP